MRHINSLSCSDSFHTCSTEQVQPHTCQAHKDPLDRFDFCQECHVLMSRTTLTNSHTIFYRSPQYAHPDIFNTNPNHTFELLIQKQSLNRSFNINRPNPHWRPALIHWIHKTCNCLDFAKDTFHLSVSIFDAIFSSQKIHPEQLKFMAFIAVYLAAKFLEKYEKIPSLEFIISQFNQEFTPEQFTDFETKMLALLGWNLNLKTPLNFLTFFFGKGVISSADFPLHTPPEQILTTLDAIQTKCVQLVEASFTNYSFNIYSAITVATSAIAVARKLCDLRPWSSDLVALTRVHASSIESCVENLWSVRDVIFEQPPSRTPQTSLNESYIDNMWSELDTSIEEDNLTNIRTTPSRLVDDYELENTQLSFCENQNSEKRKIGKRTNKDRHQFSDGKSQFAMLKTGAKFSKIRKGKKRTSRSTLSLRMSVEKATMSTIDVSSPKRRGTSFSTNYLFEMF